MLPDLPTFLQQARAGVRFPVCREIPLEGRSPVDLFTAIRDSCTPLLLESGKAGRYSYIAIDSGEIWTSRGTLCEIRHGESNRTEQGDPFELLRARFAAENVIPNPLLRNFAGGAIGYLSYDMARHIEKLPDTAHNDLDLPESCFLFVDSFFEIDQADDVIRVVFAPVLDERALEVQYREIERQIDRMISLLSLPLSPRALPTDEAVLPQPNQSVSEPEFCGMVERAREYIVAGDIFQVNLSIRYGEPYSGDAFEVYRALREINPSPYMSYLEMPGLTIASASPEQLLRVDGRVVETRPIAGTRPRGATDEEDRAYADELIGNEKERAEHLMLVDLERNDIGRVARYGTVEVDELMAIERYSHVIHIVSNVRGELAEGRDTFDAIRACFPGGTITGAPKVRSMEIIEELEPVRRGIYTGSIGWIGYDGRAELNIAIRTVVIAGGMAYAQAGAGIVFDSVPKHEYRESARKAQAALEAIRRATARNSTSEQPAAQ